MTKNLNNCDAPYCCGYPEDCTRVVTSPPQILDTSDHNMVRLFSPISPSMERASNSLNRTTALLDQLDQLPTPHYVPSVVLDPAEDYAFIPLCAQAPYADDDAQTPISSPQQLADALNRVFAGDYAGMTLPELSEAYSAAQDELDRLRVQITNMSTLLGGRDATIRRQQTKLLALAAKHNDWVNKYQALSDIVQFPDSRVAVSSEGDDIVIRVKKEN